MKTTLNAEGKIGIPEEIRQRDYLTAGDLFEVERLTQGHYVFRKQPAPRTPFIVATAEDGLPVIRAGNRVITSELVKEIESQVP